MSRVQKVPARKEKRTSSRNITVIDEAFNAQRERQENGKDEVYFKADQTGLDWSC